MKKLLTITEAAEYLGISAQTLRRWHNKGSFRASFVGPGGHRLYAPGDLEKLTKGLVQIAREWVSTSTPYPPMEEFYCQTSDVFKARLERMVHEMESSSVLKEISPLVSSIAGEIGNNSFDHNLGNWPDIPGAFFAYDLGKRILVIADRGRGVLQTLRNVRPQLKNDAEALHVAFTEVVTGRAPENRGNGLKYVRKVVSRYGFNLQFQSGNALLAMRENNADPVIQPAEIPVAGCFTILTFSPYNL